MRVSFDGECTVVQAEEIKQALLDALQTGAPLELDLSAATRIDLAFCQLIHALLRGCGERGVACSFSGRLPAGLAPTARLCGIPESALQTEPAAEALP